MDFKKAVKIIAGLFAALLVVLLLARDGDKSLDELTKVYANEHSDFLVADGVHAHYRIEGQGQPVVLLHGAASSLHTWDAWAERFVTSGYQVIRFDLPGFGLSGPRADKKYAISGAQPAEAFLETLEKAFAEWRKANPTVKLQVSEGPSCEPNKACD